MPTNICRYIHVTGARCGSPSLTHKAFCYHHIKVAHHHHRASTPSPPDPTPVLIHTIPKDHLDRLHREPVLAEYYAGTLLANRRATQPALDFPPLEDRESIQLALSMLITSMAHNRIDLRHATGLLYGLQVASANARGRRSANAGDEPPTAKVRETVLDDSGLLVAPDEDPEPPNTYDPPGAMARLFEHLEQQELEKAKLAEEKQANERATAEAANH
jgi:hypothetical protein